jgi:hypothetical protein
MPRPPTSMRRWASTCAGLPAAPEPPGVGAAVLVAWLVRVNPGGIGHPASTGRQAESFDLPVIADGTFVIRPIQAKLGPSSAEEFDLG